MVDDTEQTNESEQTEESEQNEQTDEQEQSESSPITLSLSQSKKPTSSEWTDTIEDNFDQQQINEQHSFSAEDLILHSDTSERTQPTQEQQVQELERELETEPSTTENAEDTLYVTNAQYESNKNKYGYGSEEKVRQLAPRSLQENLVPRTPRMAANMGPGGDIGGSNIQSTGMPAKTFQETQKEYDSAKFEDRTRPKGSSFRKKDITKTF